MKIMVVEDTEDSRILLVDMLEVQGYDVISEINGLEALEQIHISSPDIIISDILMPEMDGFELCQKLKKDPQLKKIPFIFYTATYTEPSDQQLALSMGATRFIIKPEDPVKLLATIAEVITEHKAQNHGKPSEQLLEDCDFKEQHIEVVSKKLSKKLAQLEEQKEQLRIITDAIPELIAEIDASGCFQYVNEAYEKWFQRTRDEIIGNKIEDIVGEQCFATIHAYLEKAHKGEELSYETQLNDTDGNTRFVKIRYIPRKSKDGKHNGFFWFTYDLTKQKLAEKEKEKLVNQLRHSQKMDAIGQLAGGIAHDFNNILAAMMGYAELARLKLPGTDRAAKNIDQLLVAGNRAKELVKQILDFSRKSDQQKKPINIDLIVKEALQLLRSSLPATIEIRTSIDRKGGLICIDPTSIHQIIVNLCTNASDAIGNENGKLELTLKEVILASEQISDKQTIRAGSFLLLKVKDTGTGMDKKTVERIFEPYFTTKKQGKGTGLGLSVVNGIVEDSNGFIEVESSPGKGTVFQVFLPTLKDKQSPVIDKKESAELSTGNERILYVDDEPMLTDIGSSILTTLGYSVTTETNSAEALKTFQKNPESFDLVITDQTMPDLTGVELAKAILELKPDLPIILCTGYISDLLNEEASALGIKRFVTKPLSHKNLSGTVRQVLDS